MHEVKKPAWEDENIVGFLSGCCSVGLRDCNGERVKFELASGIVLDKAVPGARVNSTLSLETARAFSLCGLAGAGVGEIRDVCDVGDLTHTISPWTDPIYEMLKMR